MRNPPPQLRLAIGFDVPLVFGQVEGERLDRVGAILEPVGEILQLDEVRGDVGQRPSTDCILDGVRFQSFDQSSGFGDGSGIAEGYMNLC
jgi:hypothetical protein